MNLLRLLNPLFLIELLTFHGGGKGGGAPAAPDYVGAANAQSAASQELATQNTWANRPTQNTPWGSTFWTTGQQTDPATGQPVTTWTQNQTLDPALQGALNDQLAIQSGKSQLAGSFMGRVANEYSQPFNWQGLPGMANTPQAQFTYGRNMQTGVQGQPLDTSKVGQTTYTTNEPAFAQQRMDYFNAGLERMAPSHQRQEDQTRTMLANQGLTPGSEAYNTELERLHQQQAGERWNALEQSGQEQQRMQNMLLGQQQQAFGQAGQSQQMQNAALQGQFGQNMQQGQFYNQAQQQMFGQDQAANAQNYQQMMQQANYQNQLRQQAIAEQAMARGMSLNEMNALLSGQQVSVPGMPGFNTATSGQAPNLLGAAQAQGQYGLGMANLGQQESSNFWGGLGQLAGTGAQLYGMGFFSDARLKSNVKRVGTHPRGIGIYEYDIFGTRERGVMAHEVYEVAPHLVSTHPSGYLMVNYGGL